MKPFRESETEDAIDTVIATVRQLDSMVAVITGGDPLTRVDRAIRLIEGISTSKSLVMDTSGVPQHRADVETLIPILLKHNVHARVSLDEFDDVNSRVRPINRHYVRDKRSSYDHATETIKEFVNAGIPVTIQTVLSKFNDKPENLFDFARVLSGWGVRHWVIHVTVLAGKAAQLERRHALHSGAKELEILPEDGGLRTLRKLLPLLEQSDLNLDLRITNSNPIKHAVFLIGSEGDLFTEGMAKIGKKLSFLAKDVSPHIDVWKDVDAKAHTARYANWVDGLYPGKNLHELSLHLKHSS